ncbi:MAG: hypothetical protein MUP19_07565, partial [Candidatus Aminicenantes bacterium]|nr:hypothetical protein [Candidatus Aminicenantes bacterium]
MNAKIFIFFVLGLLLTASLSCIMPMPQPPAETPPPPEETGPSYSGAAHREIAQPDRFTLNFKGAYLVFDPQSGTLQIAAEGNVLSYGGDWEVRKIHSYLYHMRLRTWQAFFWQVNTSRKEVFQVRCGTFGSVMGGTSSREPFRVDTVGGAGASEPKQFFIRFVKSHMVYAPGN